MTRLIVLNGPPACRFADRSRAAAEPAHVEADELLAGPDEIAAMYDRLVALVETRPRAKVVWTSVGRIQDAYRGLLSSLA